MKRWGHPVCPQCASRSEEVTTSRDEMRIFVCPNGHRFNTRGVVIPEDEGTDGSAGQADQSG